MINLRIILSQQILQLIENDHLKKTYRISSAKNGAGEIYGSECTPRGHHLIRAKIGTDYPANTVFKGRRPTGEIFNEILRQKYPERDWILTRILWLSGTEVGKNRLGLVDTMRRFIYIHGTPDDIIMGIPGSKGCIRMNNKELIELFDQVPINTPVNIVE